jgi:hypothetical protein
MKTKKIHYAVNKEGRIMGCLPTPIRKDIRRRVVRNWKAQFAKKGAIQFEISRVGGLIGPLEPFHPYWRNHNLIA